MSDHQQAGGLGLGTLWMSFGVGLLALVVLVLMSAWFSPRRYAAQAALANLVVVYRSRRAAGGRDVLPAAELGRVKADGWHDLKAALTDGPSAVQVAEVAAHEEEQLREAERERLEAAQERARARERAAQRRDRAYRRALELMAVERANREMLLLSRGADPADSPLPAPAAEDAPAPSWFSVAAYRQQVEADNELAEASRLAAEALAQAREAEAVAERARQAREQAEREAAAARAAAEAEEEARGVAARERAAAEAKAEAARAAVEVELRRAREAEKRRQLAQTRAAALREERARREDRRQRRAGRRPSVPPVEIDLRERPSRDTVVPGDVGEPPVPAPPSSAPPVPRQPAASTLALTTTRREVTVLADPAPATASPAGADVVARAAPRRQPSWARLVVYLPAVVLAARPVFHHSVWLGATSGWRLALLFLGLGLAFAGAFAQLRYTRGVAGRHDAGSGLRGVARGPAVAVTMLVVGAASVLVA